jgi:hypothetical protein
MSGPLTEEKKARIAAGELTKRVNKRYAAFAKYHPEAFEVRDFLLSVIRERISKGGNYPDGPLEEMAGNELRRVAKQKRFDEAQQPKQQHDVYRGMAIGILEASAPAHLKGLVRGLSGIKEEE